MEIPYCADNEECFDEFPAEGTPAHAMLLAYDALFQYQVMETDTLQRVDLMCCVGKPAASFYVNGRPAWPTACMAGVERG